MREHEPFQRLVERLVGLGDPRARAVVVVGLLIALTVLRFVFDRPSYLGLGFLAVVPVVLASLWFGANAGALAGAVFALGFALTEVLRPTNDVHVLTLGPATLLRFLGLATVGVLVARLFQGQVRLARELDELEAAREALRPAALAQRPSLRLAAHFAPARHGVAGDFFLATAGPGDSTILVVGDVVGKGVQAAQRAAYVRAALLTFAPFEDDPARLLGLANAALIDKAGLSVDFVTAACVVHRPEAGELRWALAGHPPPLRLDGGVPLDDAGAGPPLGLDHELAAATAGSPLEPGDGVLLFTDGLTEARLPDGGFFGEERVAAVVREHAGETPEEVVSGLREALAATATTTGDDVCVLAARAQGAPRPAAAARLP